MQGKGSQGRDSPHFTLYTDGGARGNPGPAAIGIVLLDQDGRIIRKESARIGVHTNNQAEYLALIKGLEIAAIYWKGVLVCYSDSELLVKQLNGEYKIRNPGLQELHARVVERCAAFKEVIHRHVPRTDPFIAEADALVNAALDAGQ